MADVFGRLTGEAGVSTATLGAGATNLTTGIADACLHRAPLLAIAGQGSTHRLHKASHQIIDLAVLFTRVTRYSARINEAKAFAGIVADSPAHARAHKPGPSIIELPTNIAGAAADGHEPIRQPPAALPVAPQTSIAATCMAIGKAGEPRVLFGNGVVRAGAASQVEAQGSLARRTSTRKVPCSVR